MENIKVIDLPAFADQRGSFVKSFNDSLFRSMGIAFQLKESYFSVSGKNVIRGMHFQLPPYQHAKIVFCPAGAILDVVLDLRKDSPEYGRCFGQVLSAENHKALYIPAGYAHGFRSLSDDALTYYLVSSEYEPASDTGILFSSIGYDWACDEPVLSPRDRSFVAFKDFKSPF